MNELSDRAMRRTAIRPRRAVKGVDDLWDELLQLSEIVRQTLARSLSTLSGSPSELSGLIAELEANEDEINRREVHIEEGCLRVLALYEPVAIDLRRVATAFRVNGLLERIGDLAVRIARRGRKPRSVQQPEGLAQLATLVEAEASQAFALLAEPCSETANFAIERPRDLARCYREVRRELKQCLRQEPRRIDEWLRLMN